MPPMSDRWYVFLTSMSEAAQTVLIIWALANITLIARWSIKHIPPQLRTFALNAFDLWLIALNLYLFITA